MLKVLIAEDDLILADMSMEVLLGQGYEVCGIARTVDEAVRLGRIHMPDLALLDMRLADGGLGTEIAARLEPLRMGVLYASANLARIALTAADGHGFLNKPYRASDLVRSVKIVADIVAAREPSSPFPRGFRLLPAL
jgi:CheY-like chemotaxis protein